MHDYLDQVEYAAREGRLYYLALAATLAIPDMCAALGDKDGRTDGDRYRAWFDYAAPRYAPYGGTPFLTGADFYKLRCSFLHQGTTQHHSSSFSRVLFFEPGTSLSIVHMCTNDDALCVDVQIICLETVDSARRWLATVEGTEPYEKNLKTFIRRHPNGIAGFAGSPVIS